MANKLYDETSIQNIANAIRGKNGSSDSYTVGQMAQAIVDIPGGGGTNPLKAYLERTATTIDDDILESIGSYAFYQYTQSNSGTNLTSVKFREALSIGPYAFNSCSSLTSADFPKVTSVGNYAFSSCTSLTSADFSEASSVGQGAFNNCSSLTSADFPKVTYIYQSTFAGCSSLSTLILRKDSMVTLAHINAFNDTPFSDEVTTATLYVPQALISTYENNAKWSQILAHNGTTIQAIEGSPYEET